MPDIGEIIGKCPLLVAYIDRVLAVPEIKTWVEKRPDSEIWARNRRDACCTCKLIIIIKNDTNKVSLYNARIAVIGGNMGLFPFSPKFPKFRLEIEWKEPFRFCLTGIFGTTFVPFHLTKLLSPVPLFCFLPTRTITKRAVALVGSVPVINYNRSLARPSPCTAYRVDLSFQVWDSVVWITFHV